jgi:hypothetical protein
MEWEQSLPCSNYHSRIRSKSSGNTGHEHQHQRLLEGDEEVDERGQEGDMERWKMRMQLVGRPCKPEPMSLGMAHLSTTKTRTPLPPTSPLPPHAPIINELL